MYKIVLDFSGLIGVLGTLIGAALGWYGSLYLQRRDHERQEAIRGKEALASLRPFINAVEKEHAICMNTYITIMNKRLTEDKKFRRELAGDLMGLSTALQTLATEVGKKIDFVNPTNITTFRTLGGFIVKLNSLCLQQELPNDNWFYKAFQHLEVLEDQFHRLTPRR